jgi:hypothetical protein
MGIAGHRMGRGLPERLEGQLPTIDELESGLVGSFDDGIDEQ